MGTSPKTRRAQQIASARRVACMYLEGSKTLYHGTTQVFSEFDLSKAGRRDSGDLGVGVYLAKTPDLAMRYAEDNAKEWGVEPVVLKVRASLRNTADFYKLIPQLKEELGVDFPPRGNDRKRAKAITRWMLDQGYDSAQVGKEVVVYDPRRLKIIGVTSAPTEADRLEAIRKRLNL